MIFADFILQHQADDPAALALSRRRFADFPDFSLALTTLEARRKLRGKVPEWVDVPSLHFPLPLSAEQCSSSETATYKSKLLQKCNIADLTGGLGVDAWAFAKAGLKVLYNDMRPELVKAARHNFAELGLDGVQFRCAEIKPGAIDGILDGFKADVFFMDPARRDSAGGKVFRIADCSPDVTELLPELFAKARYVLIKLSPMLDITLGARELGHSVREVHVVGADGECKELLFLLDRDHTGGYSITVADGGSTLQFSPAAEQEAQAMLAPEDLPSHLFVPGKALLKAGCFKLLSRSYGLLKAGTSAHLYFADTPVAALQPFGKWLRVLESAPLDKRSIRDFAVRYPDADVTARAVPLTSEELRKRLGSRSGGPAHIFAFRHEKSGRNLMVAAAL
ncbi:MAG: class I SAM-dependent methyltransferase [Bacteroidales bacterium]|nr:class I SAM-dependent methyltransferase [Bacteroidales bacterium]